MFHFLSLFIAGSAHIKSLLVKLKKKKLTGNYVAFSYLINVFYNSESILSAKNNEAMI